jgi:signal transduction histidine kinase
MTLLRDSDEKVQGFAKIARDMTDKIAAESSVREKEMLQKLVAAQEDERKRIARDLHDELGQQLTALRLKLESIRKMCEDTELAGKIDETQIIAKSIDNGVDFLAWELRPAALDDLGLFAALEKYIREWSHHSGITAELLASGLKRTRFAPEVETNLYRITQESLNNTHKHANAKRAEVLLEKRGSMIVLIIEDDGQGFDVRRKANRRKGLGLTGMRERATLIGGAMEIESAPGRGTTIHIRVPVEAAKKRGA